MKMRQMMLLGMVGFVAAAVADSNFTHGAEDFLWSTSGNWNNPPSASEWVYINNSGIGGAHPKTSSESPCVLDIPGVTTEVLNLHLGWGTNDGGWLEVRSNLNVLQNSTIARAAGCVSGLRISGGTTTYGRSITCGLQADAHGYVEVDGGTLVCSSTPDWPLKLGENGNGTLRLRSGRVHAGYDLVIGNNPTATGLVDISGGELYVGRNANHWMSEATYRQSGGTAIIQNFLSLGSGVQNGVPSQGHLEMTGGSLVISNKLFASQNGSCSIALSGGSVWVGNGGITMGLNEASVVTGRIEGAGTTLTTTGEIYLSGGLGSVGDLTQKDGTVTAQIFNLASLSNAVARYRLEDGSLTLSNRMRVGRGGCATFEHLGGRVYANVLEVGTTSQDNNCFDARQPLCLYRQEGGDLTVKNGLQVGTRGGNGRIELLGGTFEVGGQVFVGYYPHAASAIPAKGTLFLGGNAHATFRNEVMIGNSDAAIGEGSFHLVGGGSGTNAFLGNLHFRNNAQLHATVDHLGLNPANIQAYLCLHSPVQVIPNTTRDALPGRYELARWRVLVPDSPECTFSLHPSANPALWSLEQDDAEKVLYLTLKAPRTLILFR